MGKAGSKDASTPNSKGKGEAKGAKGKEKGTPSKDKVKPKDPPLKLLLLGAAQTGKSTFLKQLQFNFINGFSQDQRKEVIRVLRDNVVVGFRDLIEYIEKQNQFFDDANKGPVAYFKEVALGVDGEPFTPEFVKGAKAVWSDKVMKDAWAKKDTVENLLVFNLDYILDNIDRIAAPGTIANDEDCLRSRVRTTNSQDIKFEFKGQDFEVFDVGGQKTSRRRWSQVIENPTAIVYFAALSDYDTPAPGFKGSKLDESVEIWKTVMGTAAFDHAAIVLMLNKIDLFDQKLKKKPFGNIYKKYTGPNELEPAATYVKDIFLGLVPKERIASFTFNFTCALDSAQMKKVFDSMKTSIASMMMMGSMAF